MVARGHKAVLEQLPVLLERVQNLHYAVQRMPLAAAREMALAVQYDWRRKQDPYGVTWPDTQDGHRYDPDRHVMESAAPEVNGTNATITWTHRAAGYLSRRYKGRPARLAHPEPGRGLGTWERRMQRMLRRLLYAGQLTQEERALIKAKAETRRAERLAQRNARRAASGLPALRPRARRRDAARIDDLLRGARGR